MSNSPFRFGRKEIKKKHTKHEGYGTRINGPKAVRKKTIAQNRRKETAAFAKFDLKSECSLKKRITKASRASGEQTFKD